MPTKSSLSKSFRRDPLKNVPLGIFLIALSLTFVLNPDLPSNIIEYFKSFETYNKFVQPPPEILLPVANFSIYLGIGLILLFVFRLVSKVAVWAAPENLSEGVFFVILNRLIIDFVEEGDNFIILVSLCLIVLGITITIGELVGYAIRRYLRV
ncbi:MAG: hypothetical protein H5T50_07870 [Nitrososphaeria archaeon]|nr:hypothetical protein [Nitrososphaeria archaeon]